MQKGKNVLTLKNTNERIDSLEKKIDVILSKLESKEGCIGKTNKKFVLNIETLERKNAIEDIIGEVKNKSYEFTDENENVFVQLPGIYFTMSDENTIEFSFDKFEDAKKLEPQAISKYKNSWIEGKIRSIPNVAPDVNQFSYNKSNKLCNWVKGELLNWKTILYIQIIWLVAYGTKENDSILPNENYNWNTERDCGFADTGNGIGEFLGIEQLFTSGRNFFNFNGWNVDTDLFSLFKKLSGLSLTEYNDKFGLWGDYCKNSDSKAAFWCGWRSDVDDAWDFDDYVALRLCKSPSEKGC